MDSLKNLKCSERQVRYNTLFWFLILCDSDFRGWVTLHWTAGLLSQLQSTSNLWNPLWLELTWFSKHFRKIINKILFSLQWAEYWHALVKIYVQSVCNIQVKILENICIIYNFILPKTWLFLQGSQLINQQQLLGSRNLKKFFFLDLFYLVFSVFDLFEHLQRYICCVHGDKVEQ